MTLMRQPIMFNIFAVVEFPWNSDHQMFTDPHLELMYIFAFASWQKRALSTSQTQEDSKINH